MSLGDLRDVTVAMPTADDDPDVVAASIDAALQQRLANPLLVVDMSRGDAVRRLIEGHGSAVRYVPFGDSRGASDSRNRILDLAETRYVVFMDSDAVPRPDCASALRAAFDADPDVAIVGARCVAIWPRRRPPLFETAPAGDFLSLFDLGDRPLDVPRVIGTTLAVDRDRVGDTRFPAHLGPRPGGQIYGEEVAFCEAVRGQGWRIRYEPGAIVGHQLGAKRVRWSWMIRRAHRAGMESVLWDRRLEPLPRSLSLADYAFLVLISPAFLAGRLAGRTKPELRAPK